MKAKLFFAFLFIFLSVICTAQNVEASDTVLVSPPTNHSPKKATIFSAVVPGLGQAYNKKYWKIPLVYAAIGVPLYFAMDQASLFNEYKDAYLSRVDDDPTTIDNKYSGVYTDDNLLSLIDYHRKNRDLLYVLTGVAYILNVVDAAVDAHLYYFDISDDLSATLKPNVLFTNPNRFEPVPSLTFSLKIGKKSSYQYH